jgi:hypothetical protein
MIDVFGNDVPALSGSKPPKFLKLIVYFLSAIGGTDPGVDCGSSHSWTPAGAESSPDVDVSD